MRRPYLNGCLATNNFAVIATDIRSVPLYDTGFVLLVGHVSLCAEGIPHAHDVMNTHTHRVDVGALSEISEYCVFFP